jgi:hypothetical protein
MTDLYLTVYSLSGGKIYKYTVEEAVPTNGWIKVGRYSNRFRIGRDVFFTEVEAIEAAKKAKAQKRAEYERKIKQLNAIDFYVKEAA